jgi:hypothetical protein
MELLPKMYLINVITTKHHSNPNGDTFYKTTAYESITENVNDIEHTNRETVTDWGKKKKPRQHSQYIQQCRMWIRS